MYVVLIFFKSSVITLFDYLFNTEYCCMKKNIKKLTPNYVLHFLKLLMLCVKNILLNYKLIF